MKLFTSVARAVLLLAIGIQLSYGETPQELQKKANDALAASQWAKASELYSQLVVLAPTDNQAWFNLGQSRSGAGKLPDAIAAFEKAAETGYSPRPRVFFEVAKVQMRLNQREQALRSLKLAVDNGFVNVAALKSAPELASLGSDASFQEVVQGAQDNLTPCVRGTHRRELDFWVGEWKVRPWGSNAAATAVNRISVVLDGCAILEEYQTPTYAGKSLNIFDPVDNVWKQFWVDQSGAVHEYAGSKSGDALVLRGRGAFTANYKQDLRMTLRPVSPDRLRHTFEETKDGGKTYSVLFDFEYNRVK